MTQFVQAENQQFYRKSQIVVLNIKPESRVAHLDGEGLISLDTETTGRYIVSGKLIGFDWIDLQIFASESDALNYVENF